MPDVPEFMRHTEQVKLRLSPQAASALRQKPAGERSAWVSGLIIRAARRLGLVGKQWGTQVEAESASRNTATDQAKKDGPKWR